MNEVWAWELFELQMKEDVKISCSDGGRRHPRVETLPERPTFWQMCAAMHLHPVTDNIRELLGLEGQSEGMFGSTLASILEIGETRLSF